MRFRIRLFQAKILLCVSLLSAASISIAEEKSGYDLLLEMFPEPYEIELARKGIAETNIDKAWERACPYRELTGTTVCRQAVRPAFTQRGSSETSNWIPMHKYRGSSTGMFCWRGPI